MYIIIKNNNLIIICYSREMFEFPKINYDVFVDELLPAHLSHYMPRPCEFNLTKGYWVTSQNRISDVPLYINERCSSIRSHNYSLGNVGNEDRGTSFY